MILSCGFPLGGHLVQARCSLLFFHQQNLFSPFLPGASNTFSDKKILVSGMFEWSIEVEANLYEAAPLVPNTPFAPLSLQQHTI